MHQYDKDKDAAALAAQQAAWKTHMDTLKFQADRQDADRKYGLDAAKVKAEINFKAAAQERMKISKSREERAAGKADEKRKQTFIGTGKGNRNETLRLSDSEVISTIANNFRQVNDWDEKTQAEVEAIVTSADFNSKSSEDIAKLLRSYAAKSPTLMQTLRDQANGTQSEYDEEANAAKVKKSHMGPPEDSEEEASTKDYLNSLGIKPLI